ncbi:MAG TPA: HAD family phosphatase [Bacteroidales bacterium]|nr:HAD family phosphatase [Bacteroidales bacterium]
MKHCRGVVFDLNGTLIWDTGLHNQAWDIFLSRHDIFLTGKQKNELIHGKNNSTILCTLFNRQLPEKELNQYILEKEILYQKLCLQNGIDYAPGATGFIEFLKQQHIPYAIATASIKENIDFYFENLGLGLLIDRQHVIYNNNRIRSKPDPEIFEIAIRVLGLKCEDVVIFEDSVAGITAAERAKPARVIIVNSTGNDYSNFGFEVITDFTQVDRDIFTINAALC